jgi:NAD(P)-dependent dehydrogenase (short-subunit alcohol dehydrogenase family)
MAPLSTKSEDRLMARLNGPDEIAATALFLASDDNTFVAGAKLSVDGGMAQGWLLHRNADAVAIRSMTFQHGRPTS